MAEIACASLHPLSRTMQTESLICTLYEKLPPEIYTRVIRLAVRIPKRNRGKRVLDQRRCAKLMKATLRCSLTDHFFFYHVRDIFFAKHEVQFDLVTSKLPLLGDDLPVERHRNLYSESATDSNEVGRYIELLPPLLLPFLRRVTICSIGRHSMNDLALIARMLKATAFGSLETLNLYMYETKGDWNMDLRSEEHRKRIEQMGIDADSIRIAVATSAKHLRRVDARYRCTHDKKKRACDKCEEGVWKWSEVKEYVKKKT